MKKQLVILGIIFLLVGLSGCLSPEEEKLIGTWSIDEPLNHMSYTFSSDLFSKKVIQTIGGISYTLNWRIECDKLYLYEDERVMLTFGYKFDNGKLCLDIVGAGQYICLEKVK